MDRNLIGSSCSNYQSKNDLMLTYNTLNGNAIGGYNSFDPSVCPLVLSKNNRPFILIEKQARRQLQLLGLHELEY